ncbi:MAG: DUF5071 domain-containing protein [Oscillospiraceae bacterium]
MEIELNSLIPKNTSDISTINRLMNLTDEEIYPIIPSLLEWIQDINWIVAPYIVSVILKHQKISEQFIAKLLSKTQNDNIWKYWIIKELLYKWNSAPCNEILNELIRISESPSEGEIYEEVNILAKEYLNSYV